MTDIELTDEKTAFEVIDSLEVFRGNVFSMVSEQVKYRDGVATRDFVKHPGAVAIVPLREGANAPEVLLVHQYRHPVRAMLWEVPAGLLDIEGEDPLQAAKRELAEEANLNAQRWDVLVDYFTTPGGSSESLRVFLARDLSQIPPAQRNFQPREEEAFMTHRWVRLDEAVRAIYEGRIHNPSAVVGLLATQHALATRQILRQPQASWLR